jgi:hypothetical protein
MCSLARKQFSLIGGGSQKLRAKRIQLRPNRCTRISPDELCTDLTNARIAGTRDVTEVAAADASARVVKLRVIEDIEEFTSDLEMHCFIEGNDLRYSQIGVVDSRAVKESPVCRPERSAVSTEQNAS